MEARDFGVNDDMGDSMQCSNHPYRNNAGGICAFCLQEKLGKLLVSTSFPLPIHVSSSSSSPPSYATSVVGTNGGLVTTSTTSSRTRNDNGNNDKYYYRTRIPFLLANNKKKKMMEASSVISSDRAADNVLKRSKSTTTPRRGHGHAHFLEDFSPRKRVFWSFLYHPSSSSSSKKKVEKITTLATSNSNVRSNIVIKEEEKEDDDESPNNDAPSSDHRKVSRSRSVGCGSRRFSGDFFERISNGCTLRRVESQREGKPMPPNNHMKERVKCGGIFGGFIIMTSSNSSSSSSSSSAIHQDHVNGKSLAHGRSNKSWGWAFASPIRAFGSSKTSSKDGNKRFAANKNATPNLAAIPSLLAVRG